MPRTRNVTRTQWDAANATNSITAGDQNYNHGCESEKENEGRPVTRTTRSQTRTGSNGSRILGSTTTANVRVNKTSKGPQNTVTTSTIKVKGKGKAKAPPPKRKKQPLQDITSQFLPAPESANRGEENVTTEDSIFQQTDRRATFGSLFQLPDAPELRVSMSHPAPTYLDSPLPPSSPPSAITPSPQYPKASNPGLSSEHNPWNQLDEGRSASHGSSGVISSTSDPFGFVALERKLKFERSAAPSPLKRHRQLDEPDEDLGQLLVADTSSPRLVRRLKRPSYQSHSHFPPAVSEHPNYFAPSTPHKDKKRARLSHEEACAFSPCSSSIPSTPSPSKLPVQKQGDTLNNLKGDQEVEGVLGRTRNRTARGIVKAEPSATSKVTKTALDLEKSLDDNVETEEDRSDSKHAKVKKNLKKLRSTGTKKSKKEKPADKDDEEAYGEKWERERQARAAYFKRLEGYQVEKEDVYVI